MNIVKCDIPAHDEESIRGLCLNQDCQHHSAHCSRCQSEFHQGCKKQLKTLADIPFMLQQFECLQQSIQELKDKVASLFNEYISQLEKESETILKYKEIPKLSNLNALGTMMKNINSQFIAITIQQLNQDIDQCFKDLQYKWNQEQYFLNQGNDLFDQQRYQEAVDCYDQVIELNVKNVVAWNNKGDILHNLLKYEEAIVCYDKVIETNAGNEHTWNNKGYALFNMKKYKEAFDCYDMALQLNPEKSETFNNKALILIEQKLYEEAIILLKQAIKLNPKEKTYKLNLKMTQEEL